MLKIGVIGYGYWGPNLVRNFAEAPGAKVTMIAERDSARRERASARYPGITITADSNQLITSSEVDAVVIATPVATHYELALAALQADKHVLVEKPMASSAAQCQHLIDEAEKRSLTLMVDHTFVYTGAVRKIRELVETGELGDLFYYDSTRVNLGLFQGDVNVLWDLAVHDLSIMDYVLDARPRAVSATGIGHIAGQPENVAYLTLFYDDSLIAHVNVNWLAPVKIRRTLISGSRKMIVYDALEPIETLKIYDKGITTQPSEEDVFRLLIGYRTGDMYSPKIDGTEALMLEARHFIACCNDGSRPQTDGHSGLAVVRVLEAAAQSIAQRGSVVELKD